MDRHTHARTHTYTHTSTHKHTCTLFMRSHIHVHTFLLQHWANRLDVVGPRARLLGGASLDPLPQLVHLVAMRFLLLFTKHFYHVVSLLSLHFSKPETKSLCFLFPSIPSLIPSFLRSFFHLTFLPSQYSVIHLFIHPFTSCFP